MSFYCEKGVEGVAAMSGCNENLSIKSTTLLSFTLLKGVILKFKR